MTPQGTYLRVPVRRLVHTIPLVVAVGITIVLANLADLPKWARYYPREWKIPADKKLTEWLKFLAEELDLGLFTFLELTRAHPGLWPSSSSSCRVCSARVSSSTAMPWSPGW